jgi:hypothetical protein
MPFADASLPALREDLMSMYDDGMLFNMFQK